MKKKIKMLVLLVALALPAQADIYKGESPTLLACLQMIENTVKNHTGESLSWTNAQLIKDVPDHVKGFLGPNSKYWFQCIHEQTATRGSFWEGFVLIKD